MHPRILGLLDGWKKHHTDISNFLIAGGDLPAREEVASAITHYLLCADECGKCLHCLKYKKNVHPDVFIVARSAASIKIEQIRLLRQEIRSGPFSAPYRIIQIPESDTLTPEASSALLKSAEEAPRNTIFIFMARAAEVLPSTLVSRCQKLLLPDGPLPMEEKGLTPGAKWMESNFGDRYQTLEKMGESKRALPELQEFIVGLYQTIRIGNAAGLAYLQKALEAEQRINFHVNTPLALSMILMNQVVDE